MIRECVLENRVKIVDGIVGLRTKDLMIHNNELYNHTNQSRITSKK